MAWDHTCSTSILIAHLSTRFKNFKLEPEGIASELYQSHMGSDVLQCGRLSKKKFFVDFTRPLSQVQAFALAIGSTVSQPYTGHQNITIDVARQKRFQSNEEKKMVARHGEGAPN